MSASQSGAGLRIEPQIPRLTVTVIMVIAAFATAPTARAAVVVFTGQDLGAPVNAPRPNADTAAASFATAAAARGTASRVDFESAPLGKFHNLAIAPGVTLNGVAQGGEDQ